MTARICEEPFAAIKLHVKTREKTQDSSKMHAATAYQSQTIKPTVHRPPNQQSRTRNSCLSPKASKFHQRGYLENIWAPKSQSTYATIPWTLWECVSMLPCYAFRVCSALCAGDKKQPSRSVMALPTTTRARLALVTITFLGLRTDSRVLGCLGA